MENSPRLKFHIKIVAHLNSLLNTNKMKTVQDYISYKNLGPLYYSTSKRNHMEKEDSEAQIFKKQEKKKDDTYKQ